MFFFFVFLRERESETACAVFLDAATWHSADLISSSEQEINTGSSYVCKKHLSLPVCDKSLYVKHVAKGVGHVYRHYINLEIPNKLLISFKTRFDQLTFTRYVA